MEKYNTTFSQPPSEEENQGISIKDILVTVLVHWRWFALSLLICMGIAFLVSKASVRYYSRTASIMIKDKQQGGTASAGDLLVPNKMLSLGGASVVDNELHILKSRSLMMQVVDRLNLCMEYSYKPMLRPIDLYSESPVHVYFPDEGPYASLSLVVVPQTADRVWLKGFADKHKLLSVPLNDTVQTPIGRVVVVPTWSYNSYLKKEISVSKRNIKAVTNRYRGAVSVARADKQSNAVNLSISDPSGEKAEDILNTLIQIYREEAVKDKAVVIDQSMVFINNRIKELDKDLGVMESGLASFMRSNRLIAVGSYGQNYLKRSDEYIQERELLENQIAMVNYLMEFVNDMKDDYRLVPAEMGLSDGQLASVISEYNTTLLQKQKLDAKGNTANNPMTKEINSSLSILKEGVLSALSALKTNLRQQLNRQKQLETQASSKVQAVPEHQNYLTSVEREQSVKSSLYLFLLNRREELSLSKAALEDDVRIIDDADGPSGPTKPRTSMIYMVALVLGLAIPVLIYFLLRMMDTAIHSKREVEANCSLPVLGEIPKQSAEQEAGSILVTKENGRDSISESFRIIRSNLEYLKTDRDGSKVLLFTSFFANSGKSFLSTNLSLILAASGKKVLLVDTDIRKNTLSKKLSRTSSRGLSNYLSGKIDLEELMAEKCTQDSGFDVIFAGPVPPNPAELLGNPRMDAFMEHVRSHYDYILLDSVPTGIVADVDIVKRLADITLFVIRANVTDKRALKELEAMYQDNRYPHLCAIVNDVNYRKMGYGYGYGGYGYGYGYGYHSGRPGSAAP